MAAAGAVQVRRAQAGDVSALAELRWAWACERGTARRSLGELRTVPDVDRPFRRAGLLGFVASGWTLELRLGGGP